MDNEIKNTIKRFKKIISKSKLTEKYADKLSEKIKYQMLLKS